jgi:hypothetical protein
MDLYSKVADDWRISLSQRVNQSRRVALRLNVLENNSTSARGSGFDSHAHSKRSFCSEAIEFLECGLNYWTDAKLNVRASSEIVVCRLTARVVIATQPEEGISEGFLKKRLV